MTLSNTSCSPTPQREQFQVDVVIPLYNKRATIARAVASVVEQDCPNWNLTIVDDGSTDGGDKIAEEIQRRDDRIRVIRQNNAGPGVARNVGIKAGAASLVSFLDADDYWAPDFLSTAIERLSEYPHAEAYVGSFVIEPEGILRVPFLEHEPIVAGVWRMPANLSVEEAHRVLNFFQSDAITIRRQCLEPLGGFYPVPGCTYGEDAWLWLKFLLRCAFYRDPKVVLTMDSTYSQLGIGRKEVKPPGAVLENPESVRDACPKEYRCLLECLLTHVAYLRARANMHAGRGAVARHLIRLYPSVRQLEQYNELRWGLLWYPLRRRLRDMLRP